MLNRESKLSKFIFLDYHDKVKILKEIKKPQTRNFKIYSYKGMLEKLNIQNPILLKEYCWKWEYKEIRRSELF